jgi:hypothetical protein
MNSDLRRCRRCKRKRLEDEPPEVRQYKTCAKCRIIERNKKNSRKPLAEETMLYGLKQFQEQSLSGNFMEEEGLLKDEFFKRFQNKTFNYEMEIHEVLSNPNYVSPVISTPSVPTYNFKLVNENNFKQPSNFQSHNFQAPATNQNFQPTQAYASFQQNPSFQSQPNPNQNFALSTLPIQGFTPNIPNQQHSKPAEIYRAKNYFNNDSDEEDIFSELSKLGNREELRDDDEVEGEENENGALEPSSQDASNPYSFKNVFDNFQLLLLKIVQSMKANENLTNLVYLKEFNEEFTSNLARFDSTSSKTDVNNPNVLLRLNDKQVRTNLLNNLRELYIEPIMAMINVGQCQESSNLNEFKNTNSIKSLFTFNPNKLNGKSGFANSGSFSSKIKNSSIYLNYNRKFNVLIIKINHILHKPSTIKYSQEFRNKIRDIFKKLKYERSFDEPIDFNAHTANLVYDKLFTKIDMFTEQSQQFIKGLNKEKFVSDFINFDNVFKQVEDIASDDDLDDSVLKTNGNGRNRASDTDKEDGPDDEEDDEEEEDEEDEEDEEEEEEEEDDDDDMDDMDDMDDNDNDSTILTHHGKESTAEILDPVFKPE